MDPFFFTFCFHNLHCVTDMVSGLNSEFCFFSLKISSLLTTCCDQVLINKAVNVF